nr:hypothetical protein CFP56_59865 [Quercus suber]
MAVSHGPSLDTIVSPAPELVDNETQPTPAYNEMSTYSEFYELQQSGKIGYKLGTWQVASLDLMFASIAPAKKGERFEVDDWLWLDFKF